MTIRTFCDHCNRDISKHDRLTVRLDTGIRDELVRKPGQWDFCIQCARTLDLNKLVNEQTP